MSSSATISSSSQSAFASIVNLSLELDTLLDDTSGDTIAEKMQCIFIRALDQESSAFSLMSKSNWLLRWNERCAVHAHTIFGSVQVMPYNLEENLAYLQTLFLKAASSQQIPEFPQGTLQERVSQHLNCKFSGNVEKAVGALIDRIGFATARRHLDLQRKANLDEKISEIRTLFTRMLSQNLQALQTTAFIDKVLEIRGELRSLQNSSSDSFERDLARIKANFMSSVPKPLVSQDDKNNYFDILFQIRSVAMEHAIHIMLPVHSREHESCPRSVVAVLASGQGSFTHILQCIRKLLGDIGKEVSELQSEITQYDRANTLLWNRLSSHETTLKQCLNVNAKSNLCAEVDKLTKCVSMRITQSTTLGQFYPLYGEIRRCTCEMIDLVQELPNLELRSELQGHMEQASKDLQEVQMDHYLQLLRSEALPQVRKVLAEVMESKDPAMAHTLERNLQNALSFLRGVYHEVAQVRDPHQLQVIWELITTLEEAKGKLSSQLQTPSGNETQHVASDDDEHAKSLYSNIVDGKIPSTIVSMLKQYGPSVLFTCGVTYLTGGLPLGISLLAGLGATAGAKLADGTAQQILPKSVYEALGPFIDCSARLAVSYMTKGSVELTDFHPWAFRNINSSSTAASKEDQGASNALGVASEKGKGEFAIEFTSSSSSEPVTHRLLELGQENEAEKALSIRAVKKGSSARAGEVRESAEWQAPDCVMKAFAYLATGMSLQQNGSDSQKTIALAKPASATSVM